jgi:hypothetical protein
MRYCELVEDARADLAQRAEAEKIVSAFQSWLHAHNAKTPLKDTPAGYTRPFGRGRRAWVIPARDVGLDLDNLYFGFTWSENGEQDHADAALTRASDEGRAVYFATFSEYGSPLEKTDISYSCRWDDMQHEIIHYLDYVRGIQRNGRFSARRSATIAKRKTKMDKTKSMAPYFDDPLERNAYFQDGFNQLFKAIVQLTRYRVRPDRDESLEKRLASFASFLKMALPYFRGQWVYGMSPRNKNRLMRRLHRVYSYIKETWPHTEEVVAAVEKLKAEEAAQEARWAEEDRLAAAAA